MWRTYFTIIRQQRAGDDPHGIYGANMTTFSICDKVLKESFVRPDQDILEMYFTSRWGDDLYAVEDYSLKNNIPTKVIWMVVRRANRTVMEECGFLERKEDGDE